MNTYRANVRVAKSGGVGTMLVWATVVASNPIAAKSMLEAIYGRGNVVSLPMLVR